MRTVLSNGQLLESSVKRLAFPVPYQFSLDSLGQRDFGRQRTFFADSVFYRDVAARVGHRARNLLQLAERGLDEDARESRSVAVDTEDRAEKFDVRARAPSMAIRARRFGLFGPGREAQCHLVFPHLHVV